MVHLFAIVSEFVHDASIVIITTILVMTMIMSVFLYKVIFKSDFFNSYDRNL
jgi:hypothetical protein